MNIGSAIKKIRLDKGIGQGELALKCDLSQTSLSQIESGSKRPNPNNLKKICKNLNIPETLIYLYALEEVDIPKSKKNLFKTMYPAVINLIEKLV